MKRQKHLHNTLDMERRLGDGIRAYLPHFLSEFIMFGLKQAWAALFGGLLLCALIGTAMIWQDDWPLARYDALLIYAVSLQVFMILFKLETWSEARVIVLFHLTGTLMEIFKVHMVSWAYPGDGIMKFMDVPLFSGFMYASVGSYIARVSRIFKMRFAPYPPFWVAGLLALAIYLNFYSHHFIPDLRMGLFIASVWIFWRTRIWFCIGDNTYWMPLPLAVFLASFFLWVAENIGTQTATWVYAGRAAYAWTDITKMGSWYLLLYVSFATVSLVIRDHLVRAKQSEKL